MDVIAVHYNFLLDLVAAEPTKQHELLDKASAGEVLAVVECVKLCTKNQVPGKANIRGKVRWKRAVHILKRNRTLLKPALLAIVCALVREAIHSIYEAS